MANGFQQDAPDVPVARGPQVTESQDSVLASGIEVGAEIAGNVRREGMERQQRRSFEELADTAFQADQMTPEQAQHVLDTSDADRQFRSLYRARTQGRISETGVALEAEKILRQNIQRAPGFEQDFRRLASDVLGYDPTGTQTQATIEMATRDPSERPDVFQSDVYQTAYEESQDLARILNQPVERVFNGRIEEIQSERNLEALENQMSLGTIQTDRAWDTFATNKLPHLSRQVYMATLYEQDENGALRPKESVDAANVQQTILSQKRAMFDEFRRMATRNGVSLSNEQAKNYRERIDNEFAQMEELAQDRDLMERVSRNRQIVEDSYEIAGAEFYSDLYLANSLGVQREYFELLKTPEQLRNIFTMIDPNIAQGASIADIGTDVKRRVFEIIGGDFDLSDPRDREVVNNGVGALGAAGTDDARDAGLDIILGKGDKPIWSLSNLARPDYSYNKLSERQRNKTLPRANVQAKTILRANPTQRIADWLRNDPGGPQEKYELTMEGGQIKLKIGARGAQRVHTRTATGTPINRWINGINMINRAAENGYGTHLEDWSPGFIEQKYQEIQELMQEEQESN